jgi:hypothetical protein
MQKIFTTVLITLLFAAFGSDVVTAQTTKQRRKSTRQKQAPKPPTAKTSDSKTTVSAAAQSVAGMPGTDAIFARYQKAIGSPEDLRKITSRVSRGTFELTVAGISASLEVYEKAPNKTLTVIELPGFGTILQGYNGSIAFEQQPQSGLRELSGKELAKAKRSSDFYDDLNLKAQYTKLTLTGVETVGANQAYRIEALTPEGDIEKLYFDKQTFLLVRKDESSVTPQGVFPVQIYIEDYREIDGIKIPFASRISNPSIGNIVIKLTEVKHNVAIEDSKFDKPSAP